MKKVWTSLSWMTSSLVYGFAVTMTLALYYALIKHGRIEDLPRLIRLIATQLTPWMMLGQAASRRLLPDVEEVTRPQSLLLPAIEGVLAVVFLTVLFLFGELDSPYANMALDLVRLVASVTAARYVVQRTFRW